MAREREPSRYRENPRERPHSSRESTARRGSAEARREWRHRSPESDLAKNDVSDDSDIDLDADDDQLAKQVMTKYTSVWHVKRVDEERVTHRGAPQSNPGTTPAGPEDVAMPSSGMPVLELDESIVFVPCEILSAEIRTHGYGSRQLGLLLQRSGALIH
jgi:hypothetical protein